MPPSNATRLRIVMLENLISDLSMELLEIRVRLKNFPTAISGTSYLEGRRDATEEHIEILKRKRDDLLEQCGRDQDSYLRRSGLSGQEGKR